MFSGFAAHPMTQFGLSQAQSFIHNMSIPSVCICHNISLFCENQTDYNLFFQFLKDWLHALKYYFTVNNTYVLTKLRILLLPPLHKVCILEISFLPQHNSLFALVKIVIEFSITVVLLSSYCSSTGWNGGVLTSKSRLQCP